MTDPMIKDSTDLRAALAKRKGVMRKLADEFRRRAIEAEKSVDLNEDSYGAGWAMGEAEAWNSAAVLLEEREDG